MLDSRNARIIYTASQRGGLFLPLPRRTAKNLRTSLYNFRRELRLAVDSSAEGADNELLALTLLAETLTFSVGKDPSGLYVEPGIPRPSPTARIESLLHDPS